MRRKYILHLAPSCLTAFSVGRDGITAQSAFPLSTEAYPAFEAFLSGLAPATRVTLLVDLPEEAHHIEALPFVRGRDRQALLARRQDHLFGDTPFRSQLSLGRESSGRRDERILFAAFTRPAMIQPWLERIIASPCILDGMTSTSFLSQALAIPLQPATHPFLFAHLTPAGLRVSCFEHGQLRFSRLTVSPTRQPESDPNFLREEIRRSFDYLVSQRVLPHDQATDVRALVADEASRDALKAAFSTQANLSLQPVLMAEAGAALGLTLPPGNADSLPLLLHVLATRRPPLPQFAPAEALSGQRLQRLGIIAKALAAAVFLACLGSASLTLFEARGQRKLAEASLRQAAATEVHLADVLAETPALPLPLAHLQDTVDSLQALAASARGPEPALRQLAAALTPVTGFRLQEVEWSVTPVIPEPPETPAGIQNLRVRFDLPAGIDRTRERVDQARSLLAALGAVPGARIEILRQPPETSGSEPLRVSESLPGDSIPQLEVRLKLPASPP